MFSKELKAIGCSATLEHALIHTDSAIGSNLEKDFDQVNHDLYIIKLIILTLMKEKT